MGQKINFLNQNPYQHQHQSQLQNQLQNHQTHHPNPKQRKIIHIDMDAFFTSVEQRDQPHLIGKPVIVGGNPRERGVVAAASYEARKFGIRSAMPTRKALSLCPQAIFLRPRFSRYEEVSDQIHSIFQEVTSLIEPLSLDEAFLDVTDNLLSIASASEIATIIKKKIVKLTGLTASAGVGPNKLVAKIACGWKKPDGLVVVPPPQVLNFLQNLPIDNLWGVGPVTRQKLNGLGIFLVKDLWVPRDEIEDLLNEHLGASYARSLWEMAHGQDDREVCPYREPKGRGIEETFKEDIDDDDLLIAILQRQSEELSLCLQELQKIGRTLTLKIRFADFNTITRRFTSLLGPISPQAKDIFQVSLPLFKAVREQNIQAIRLMGLSISNFTLEERPKQLSFDFLFD